MKFRISVALTEVYSAWIEAEDEEAAEEIADKMFSEGKMEYVGCHSEFFVDDKDDT